MTKDDIMFLYHGANGPESSMTLYFKGVHQVAVLVGCQTTTEAKSAIYNCFVDTDIILLSLTSIH